jgi:heme exporter protein D
VSYVDAGYAVTLVTLLVYAVGLVLRRRRWERALEVSEAPATESQGAPARGERS